MVSDKLGAIHCDAQPLLWPIIDPRFTQEALMRFMGL
jgi:hypothetical protein